MSTGDSLGKYFEQSAQTMRGVAGAAALEAILPSNDANQTLRNNLNALASKVYQFQELRPGGIDGQYVLVEFPPTGASRLKPLNDRASFVLDAGRFRTALGKVATGGFDTDVVNGQLSIMSEKAIKDDIDGMRNDIDPTGSAPDLLRNIRIEANKVCASIVAGGDDIKVPHDQWLHWRMVEGVSGGRIMSRMMLERSLPIAAIRGIPPPSGKIEVPGADPLLVGKLKMLLSDPVRYERGIRRAIYETQVRSGAPNVRGEFERATALGSGAARLQTIEAIPGVPMVTLQVLEEGGQAGFVPVYNLRLRRAGAATPVDITNFMDRREFVDRKDI